MNTGQKSITAISIRKTTLPEEVVFSDFPPEPLLPGETRTIPGWDNADHITMQVDAVIVEDGTSMGISIDPFYGKGADVVSELFEWRRGEARRGEAKESDRCETMEEWGRFNAQNEIKNHAKNIEATLLHSVHDVAWVHQNMLNGWVLERAGDPSRGDHKSDGEQALH